MLGTKFYLNELYLVVSCITVLIFILVVFIYCKKCKKKSNKAKYAEGFTGEPLFGSTNTNGNFIIEADNHMKEVNDERLIKELLRIKTFIDKNRAGYCQDITPQLNQAISDLKQFIDQNPETNQDYLCSMDTQSNLKNQLLADINPNYTDYTNTNQSILDIEDDDRNIWSDPMERISYLIRNLDVAIQLVRTKVCHKGKLNLSRLYKIIQMINQQLCKVGKTSIDERMQSQRGGIGKLYKIPMPSSRIDPYMKNSFSIEPFEGRSTMLKAMPKKRVLNKFNAEAFTDYSEIYHGPRVVDRSVEGKAITDIAHQRTPGDLISQLYDKDDYYTVNVNSCNQNTYQYNDSDLFKSCTQYDLELIDAVNGHGQNMLHCIDGDCDSPKNVMQYYKEFPDSLGKQTDLQDLRNYNKMKPFK